MSFLVSIFASSVWKTIWSWLKPALPYLVVVIAVWQLAVHLERVGERRQASKDQSQITHLQETITSMKLASQQAAVADHAHAQQVQAAQDQTSKEIESDLQLQLAQARTAAAGYAQRLRAGASEAHPGSGSSEGMPTSADAAGGADGAGETPELDAEACAEAVTKAQGWQDWWSQTARIPR